ncbi:MAG: cation diffusion facilitator family transporter [Gemmatimonadota bacterium]
METRGHQQHVEDDLTRYGWISLFAALGTIGLKGGAWILTGSVGLFSDALESVVNLVAAGAALFALKVAARPPDEEHAYGHTKAEYFSSGFEGALVLVAAVGILYAGVVRLLEPQPVQQLTLGLVLAGVASVINLVVARILERAARDHGSAALEADARHLMADVWTSVAVIGGLGVVAATGWQILDPLLALLVGANVVRMGLPLLRRSMLGLLDTALPERDQRAVEEVLDRYRGMGAGAAKGAGTRDQEGGEGVEDGEAREGRAEGIEFHALRTRRAGRWRFVSFHVLVPGEWSVQRGHDLLEEIEEAVRDRLPGTTVFTHLEPLEDPASFTDTGLVRDPAGDETSSREMRRE